MADAFAPMPVTRPRAVITGASRGIGAAFAAALARDHFDVVLVARNQERLEAQAQRLRETWGVTAEVAVADLTRGAELRALEMRLAEDARLELLVNNAGGATVGPFARLDPDQEEGLIALNAMALARLTRAVLPGMIERGRGAIINVSSIASFVPARYAATYSATKAYVNSFTEALHEELRGTGVRVQLLCPGFTRTEFPERAGADTSYIPALAWMAPEAVAVASLAALRRGTLVCVPGTLNRALTTLLRVLPRRFMRRLTGAGAKRGWASARLRDRPG
jgi:short-subunit dehydrogenase